MTSGSLAGSSKYPVVSVLGPLTPRAMTVMSTAPTGKVSIKDCYMNISSQLTNANRSRDTEPACKVQAARHAQQPAGNHGNTNKSNGAESVLRDRIEANGQSHVGRCTNQTQVEHMSRSNDGLQWTASHDSADIYNISDLRIPTIELDENVCRVCGEHAKKDNRKDAGNETNRVKHSRKTENTNADLVGKEDQSRLFDHSVRRGLVHLLL